MKDFKIRRKIENKMGTRRSERCITGSRNPRLAEA